MAPAGKLDFDHVALATHDATPALELFVGRLGATDLYGAADRGFRWALVHAGDADGGMLVELLEPWSVEQDPFLARFLERRGEGAHHLTFKTKDIGRRLARLNERGSRSSISGSRTRYGARCSCARAMGTERSCSSWRRRSCDPR